MYVDGELKRTIDTYFYYANQEYQGINIYHILNLPDGKHTIKLAVKGDRNPNSAGSRLYVTSAIVYKTADKKSANFKFSFQ